jgi:hypothetical protein
MVWPMVKQAIERSIRKVKCTVFWKDGSIANEYTIYTFWADPEKLKTLPGLGGEAKEGDEDAEGARTLQPGAPEADGPAGRARPAPPPAGSTMQVGGMGRRE